MLTMAGDKGSAAFHNTDDPPTVMPDNMARVDKKAGMASRLRYAKGNKVLSYEL